MVKLRTMVKAFRASGIYPVNQQAINPKKLGPSTAHSSEPASSSSDASCSIKLGVGASKLALQALEEELDEATTHQFNKRFEEGYDLTGDALYTARAKLKRGTQPLADIPNTRGVCTSSNPASASDSSTLKTTPSLPNSNCGWLLDDGLRIPVQQQAKRTNREAAHLPKHLSSEEMVKFPEERRCRRSENCRKTRIGKQKEK